MRELASLVNILEYIHLIKLRLASLKGGVLSEIRVTL